MDRERSARTRAGGRLLSGLSLIGAVAVVASMAVSSAAYTDMANLNLGGSGIGSEDRFDIAVVLPDNTVVQADGPAGVDWDVEGAESLVPGHSVTTEIPVFNNSPSFDADVTMTIRVRNGDGSVGSAPNITAFLRFTARLSGGTYVFTDATLADATGSIGELAKRDSAALTAGDTYYAGAPGSDETVSLTVTYLDASGVEDYNGGQSALAVHFDAESVAP